MAESGGDVEQRIAWLENAIEVLARGANVTLPPRPAGAGLTFRSDAETSAGAVPAEVLELVAKGNTIAAIKAYRDATGAGLREAKEAIERLAP